MNRIAIVLSILVLFSCNQGSNKSELPKKENKYPDKLEEYFQSLISQNKFNGAVLVQKDSDQIIYKNYNLNIETNKSLNTNRQSQFNIHSTKQHLPCFQCRMNYNLM